MIEEETEYQKYGRIFHSAKILQYQINETVYPDGFMFTWSDPLVGGGFHCPKMADRKDALMAAANILADSWLMPKENDKA